MAERDSSQLNNAGSDAFGSCCGRRGAWVLAGDVHPEDSGAYAKAQRRIEDEGFAVDAGGNGLVRIDLEGRGGPFAQRAL